MQAGSRHGYPVTERSRLQIEISASRSVTRVENSPPETADQPVASTGQPTALEALGLRQGSHASNSSRIAPYTARDSCLLGGPTSETSCPQGRREDTKPKEPVEMLTKHSLMAVVLLGAVTASLVVAAVMHPTAFIQDQAVAGRVAYAVGDCASPLGCQYGTAKTALTVRHKVDTTDEEVMPTNLSAEVWSVTAYYFTDENDPNCITCEESSASCSVTVTRSGSAFSVTASTCNTGPFVSAQIEYTYACRYGATTSPHAYKLSVIAADSVQYDGCVGGTTTANLARVAYSTTLPLTASGNKLTGECTASTLVGPTQVTYSTNDNGAFECTPDTPYGPEIEIKY